jgi:PAS domain S-box-containing protein
MRRLSKEEAQSLTRGSFARRLVVSYIIFNVLLAGFAAMTLGRNYTRSEQEARVATKNICQVLDQSLSGTIREADLGLLAVKNEFESRIVLGNLDANSLNEFIKRQHQYLPQLDSLRIANDEGLVIYGTGVSPHERIKISDRDYFRHLRDEVRTDLVMSKPVLGRISLKWVIIFARRLNYANGDFAGVVYGPILIETLQRRFAALNLGVKGVIALHNDKNELLTRHPGLGTPKETFGNSQGFDELARFVKSANVEETFFVLADTDNVSRIVTRRKLSRYPLNVLVGVSQEEYLRGWWSDVRRVVLLVLTSIIATTISGIFIYRARQRERELSLSLTKEQEKYRVVADNTFDWEYWLSPEGDVLYCSPSCFECTGRTAAEFYADRKLFTNVIIPEDQKKYEEEQRLVTLGEGTTRQSSIRILHTDGSVRWLEHTCRTVVDDKGNRLGIRGSNRDITERIVIEKERSYLSEIIERSVNEIYVYDSETLRFEHVNRGALHNMKYSLEEMKRLTPIDINPQLTNRTFEHLIRHLRDGAKEVLVFETVHQRKDLTTYPAEVRLQLVESREKPVFLAVAFDVSTRKQAEIAREEAIERVRTLEGIIPICMYCKKIRDTENSWNQLEKYITEHSEAIFSHGICPRCIETHRTDFE